MKKAEKKKISISRNTLKKILTVAICIAAALCLLLIFSLFFSVRSFELEGDTRYDINEIIDASGVRSGDRLYWLNKNKIEKMLISECPYIKSVKIKQKFPSKLCFVIEERVSGWYVQVGSDFYALDYDMRVMLETFNEESLKERGLTKLVLPELESLVVGELPKFGKDDEHLISETLKIIDSIRTHSIKERLNYLDLSNRFQIKMTVDESYEIDFGDMTDFTTKFSTVEKLIAKKSKDGYVGGRITVISPTECDFKGEFPDISSKTESGTEGEAE